MTSSNMGKEECGFTKKDATKHNLSEDLQFQKPMVLLVYKPIHLNP